MNGFSIHGTEQQTRRPHVSISRAMELLGWTRAEMTAAIGSGEIVLMETRLGKWVWREELMAKALELWSRETIEAALGEDADRVLPQATRLADLRARIQGQSRHGRGRARLRRQERREDEDWTRTGLARHILLPA